MAENDEVTYHREDFCMSFSGLYHLLRKTVYVFFIGSILLLIFLAGTSTASIRGDYTEHTYFLKDSFLLNILFCVFLLFSAFAGGRLLAKVEKSICQKINIEHLGLFLLFAISASWTLLTQPGLISDQASIQESAAQLSYGDLTPLLEEGYCARYPHQLGAVFFSIIFQGIFGRNNLICYQIFNAALCALCYKEIICIAKHTLFKNTMSAELLALGILFYPILLYSTFVYPMIPSFYFSLLSFRELSSYLEDGEKRELIKGVLAMVMAIFLKPNALVFLIALVLISAIGGYGKRSFAAAVLLVLFSMSALLLPRHITENIFHVKMPEGISPWSYLAMGMQEGERAPGWYNGYINENYTNSEYNGIKQKENAIVQIRKRIGEFKTSPQRAVRFYLRKIASEWNNPTFEAFWIHEVRPKNITLATWVKRLTRVTGAQLLAVPLNYLQFFILVGALLFGILVLPSAGPILLLFPLTFVGGMLFHLIWEAKCQYTIIYFTLLLPCSILGIHAFFERIQTANRRERIKRGTVAVLIFLLIGSMALVLPNREIISGDEEQFKQYLEEYREGKKIQK